MNTKELIERCKEEIRIFERPTAAHSVKLLEIVENAHQSDPAMDKWIDDMHVRAQKYSESFLLISDEPKVTCANPSSHVYLEGEFLADQLEALAAHMRMHKK